MKPLVGAPIFMEVEVTASISSIKERLERITGIPVDRQRISYTGKLLENDSFVTDYNVPDNGTLYMLTRLFG